MQRIVTTDPGPGPYYLAMKIWSAVSTTPGWMRLPSVFAAAGAVVLFAVLVRRLTDTRTAALAAAVLLVLPNVSRYAQEHRPYAFALLFTVLTVTLWHISVTRDRTGGARSRWWSAGFAVAAAGMGLAHLYTLTLLPALAVAAVAGPAEDRRRRLLRTVIPALAAVLAISPHIWLNLAHPTGSPTDPPLSPGSLLNVIGQMMPSELTAALGVLALVGFAVGMRRAAPAAGSHAGGGVGAGAGRPAAGRQGHRRPARHPGAVPALRDAGRGLVGRARATASGPPLCGDHRLPARGARH